MAKKETFIPAWIETSPSKGTYRSILKWGAPEEFKHPNRRLFEHIKSVLGMTDADFLIKKNTGEQVVKVDQPSGLSEKHVMALREIVGQDNVKIDDYTRALHAYGKSMLDLLRLRSERIENPPDAVVYPRNTGDVRELVMYCNANKIPIVAFGGGSGVTRGVECIRGGISLDMCIFMNRIINLNDLDRSVTVQPGMTGPALEKALNTARETYGSPIAYTCGHFPQSFEYSTVGGWVVTRGAGQNSTYYGKIEGLVLSQKYVTPVGDLVTLNVPAMATGPDLDQIMIGSEGAFGILVEVTLKIFSYQPESRQFFSYLFRDWESSIDACREVMQAECGFPSVFRLSDPEETDVALKLYGVDGTIADNFLEAIGYKKNKRCLLLGHTDGSRDYGKLVSRKISKISRKHGALSTTGYVAKAWYHGRFTDPYLREDLGDFGVVIDTLECGVTWSKLPKVWSEIRAYCHSRPNTICMSHSSHFYPQGTNLYFIFITRFNDIDDYIRFHAGIIDRIQKNGASLSHHHGIGKMLGPWLEAQIGKNGEDIIRALKNHFDPNNILNPGGTLGLDLLESEKR